MNITPADSGSMWDAVWIRHSEMVAHGGFSEDDRIVGAVVAALESLGIKVQ